MWFPDGGDVGVGDEVEGEDCGVVVWYLGWGP